MTSFDTLPNRAYRASMGMDAILMAGSRPIESKGEGIRLEEKPYLPLGGQALVERTARALLDSGSIQRVYVVGQGERLAALLGDLMRSHPDRLRLVEQGRDLIDSAYRAFFLHLLPDHGLHPSLGPHFDPAETGRFLRGEMPERDIPALFIASDLPFLTPEAVDEFVEKVPGDTALTLGLVEHRRLENMLEAIDAPARPEQWKLGAIHLRCGPIRMNNLILARPLMLDANLYQLAQTIYQYRRVLQTSGRVNARNWWSITRECLSYGRRAAGGFRLIRGMFNIAPMALCGLLARALRSGRGSGWLAWPLVQFLSLRDLGFAASLLLGARAGMVVCSQPGPALDIDVEDSYRYLASNQEAAFQSIQVRLRDPGYDRAREK